MVLRCREDELCVGLWQARFLANTAYCYRLCEGFVAETLQALERERREGRRSRYGRGERLMQSRAISLQTCAISCNLCPGCGAHLPRQFRRC